MSGDWLKLHRKSLDSRVFSDADLWRLWCWCLMKANWKSGWFSGVEVPRGSFSTGRESAAEQLEVSPSKFRRGLKKLEQFGCISTRSTNRFTVISIVNYDKYQFEDRAPDQPPTNHRPSTDQQATNKRPSTDHNRRRLRREEGKEREEGGAPAVSSIDALIEVLPKSIDRPAVREALERWNAIVHEKTGRPYSAIQLETELASLLSAGANAEKVAADITFSIVASREYGRLLDSANNFDSKSRHSGHPNGEAEIFQLPIE